MSKTCVITLDPKVVNQASENAHMHGTTLKEVIEVTITDMANNTDEGQWITERSLGTVEWAPSRITLFQMRKDGRLKIGDHYKRKGRFIYYNKKALEHILNPQPIQNQIEV